MLFIKKEGVGGMYINPQSWHARLFFQCLGIWFKFKTGDNYIPLRLREGTNICFYVRTIVVWMPMVLLAHILVAAGSVYVLVIYPFNTFGHIFFTNIALVIIAVACFIAFVAGFIWFGVTISDKAIKLANTEVRDGLTARGVVAEWLEAKISNICKFVTFKKEEVTNA
jgi:hypothetical protein